MKTRSESLFEMASYTPMIIAIFLMLTVVATIHLFVMNSVDNYNSYGDNGGSYREWVEFEKQKLQL